MKKPDWIKSAELRLVRTKSIAKVRLYPVHGDNWENIWREKEKKKSTLLSLELQISNMETKDIAAWIYHLLPSKEKWMADDNYDSQEKELLSRAISANDIDNSVCINGEEVDGVFYQYTREYMKWKLLRDLFYSRDHTEEDVYEWESDNPEPTNKYRG